MPRHASLVPWQRPQPYRMLPGPQTRGSWPITVELIDQAKEYLIANRITHLDQLAHMLGEERVRRVIEPMLAGIALSSSELRIFLRYPPPEADALGGESRSTRGSGYQSRPSTAAGPRDVKRRMAAPTLPNITGHHNPIAGYPLPIARGIPPRTYAMSLSWLGFRRDGCNPMPESRGDNTGLKSCNIR